jgi:hypothetical protein
MIINFAYDHSPIKNENQSYIDGGSQMFHNIAYHYNPYDNEKFYCINGTYKYFYADYHVPLQYVVDIYDDGIKTNYVVLDKILETDEKFVYMLTFRHFAITVENNDIINIFKKFSPAFIEAINKGQCLLLLNDSHESAYYKNRSNGIDTTIERLLQNCKEFGLSLEHICLLTGNPINEINSQIKIIFWQCFETALRIMRGKQHIPEKSENIKKFLCLNRMPRDHRYYFAYEMYKRNMLDSFNFSLNTITNEYKEELISKYHLDQSTFNNMITTLPWILDTKDFQANHWNRIDQSFMSDNLIYIVTETLLGQYIIPSYTCFITEKTFKPISYGMPFIIVGEYLTLKHLRSLGYKTFHDYWDESYDEIGDPVERMNAICDLIEDLNKRSVNDLLSLTNDMKNILLHNQNIINERRPEQPVMDIIKKYGN